MTVDLIIVISTYLYIYLGFFLGSVGSIGNLLTISTFLWMKKYRTLPSSLFLAASTFGEQLVLISSAFPDALTYALGYDYYGISSSICKSTSFLYFAGGVIALSCMYFAAIERYLKTSRSATQRHWLTLNKARLLASGAMLVSSSISIPFALYRDVSPISFKCEYVNNTFKRMASMMYAIVGVPMPIILLTVFGLLTWRNIKMSGRHQQETTTVGRYKHQVVRMILVQTGTVVCSVLPASLLQVYFLATGKGTQGTTSVDQFLLCITQLLLYLHSCTSCYVYLMVSSTFRKNIIITIFLRPFLSTRVVPFTEQTFATRVQMSRM